MTLIVALYGSCALLAAVSLLADGILRAEEGRGLVAWTEPRSLRLSSNVRSDGWSKAHTLVPTDSIEVPR